MKDVGMSLQLCDATVFPRKFRRRVGKIVAIRLALHEKAAAWKG